MATKYTGTPGRLASAIAMAAVAHQRQYDKAGQPYILHCLSVMFRVRSEVGTESDLSEDLQIIAVLHDTLEDTTVTRGEIETAFGRRVASGVQLLTRSTEEPYMQYIGRLKAVAPQSIAKIKIADLQDNLDPARHSWAKDQASKAELIRLTVRYTRALELLAK